MSAWVSGATPNKFIAPPTKTKFIPVPEKVDMFSGVGHKTLQEKTKLRRLSSLFISEDEQISNATPKVITLQQSDNDLNDGLGDNNHVGSISFKPQLIRFNSFRNLDQDVEDHRQEMSRTVFQPEEPHDAYNQTIPLGFSSATSNQNSVEAKLKNFDSLFMRMTKSSRNTNPQQLNSEPISDPGRPVPSTMAFESNRTTPFKREDTDTAHDTDLLEGGSQEVFDMKVLRKLMQIH